MSYIIQNSWDPAPVMSTAYICPMNELRGRRQLLQALREHPPLPADSETQSVLCALVSDCLALAAKCWPHEDTSVTVHLSWGHLLQGRPLWPTGHWRLLFHIWFYFWLGLLGHCLGPETSPFTLVPTLGQERKTSFSLSIPPGLSAPCQSSSGRRVRGCLPAPGRSASSSPAPPLWPSECLSATHMCSS